MGLIAIIPARAGSKGIKNKNTIDLGGKPLIEYTVQAALESSVVDKVIITTDSIEIINLYKQRHEKLIVLNRPTELSMDTTSMDPVIEHAINYYEQNQGEITDIILLQPTSPLRSSAHIDEAFQLYCLKKPMLLLSVYSPNLELQKSFKLNEDGFLEGVLSLNAPFMRRQDLPEMFLPNGAIYIFSNNNFSIDKRIPRNGLIPFIMQEEESYDINTVADLQKVKNELEKR